MQRGTGYIIENVPVRRVLCSLQPPVHVRQVWVVDKQFPGDPKHERILFIPSRFGEELRVGEQVSWCGTTLMMTNPVRHAHILGILVDASLFTRNDVEMERGVA